MQVNWRSTFTKSHSSTAMRQRSQAQNILRKTLKPNYTNISQITNLYVGLTKPLWGAKPNHILTFLNILPSCATSYLWVQAVLSTLQPAWIYYPNPKFLKRNIFRYLNVVFTLIGHVHYLPLHLLYPEPAIAYMKNRGMLPEVIVQCAKQTPWNLGQKPWSTLT